MTRASDLMWKGVPSVTAARPVRDVAEVMRRHGMDAVPIVDDEQGRRPVGVITASEIAGGCVGAGHDPCTCEVRVHMATDLILCRPDDSVSPVLARAPGKKGLPPVVVVVHEDGSLAGMVPSPPVGFEIAAAQKVEPLVGGMGGMELVWRCLDCGYQLLGAPVPPASCPDCQAPKEAFMLVTED